MGCQCQPANPNHRQERGKIDPLTQTDNMHHTSISIVILGKHIISNQIKSLLLSLPSTSALVSAISMRVLQTVQKQRHLWTDSAKNTFTYGQTVQKLHGAFTVLQTVQKNNAINMDRQCKKLQLLHIDVHLQTVEDCANTYMYSVRLV